MFIVRKLYSPDEKESGTKKSEEEQAKEKTEEDNVALAKALKEAKANSVSKEEYEKLQEENRRLIAEVINGEGGAGNGQTEDPKEVDIDALNNLLFGPKCSELTNLEFCDNLLKLRQAVIKRDGVDPFLPHGANIKPTEFDAERAQAVADVMTECVKEAGGDSGVFTALLQKRINNDSQALTAHLKRIGAI